MKLPIISLLLVPVAVLADPANDTPACDITELAMYAPDQLDAVVCLDELSADAVKSLQATGADWIYTQPLKRCGINDRRPGLLLSAIHAGSGNEALTLTDEAGKPVCSSPIQLPRVAPVPDWQSPAAEHFIDVNGIRTRYLEAGEGTPLVLVHGGQAGGNNNSADKWEQNFAELSRHYRVIAPDRLGQGQTGNPPAEDYADYYAKDAEHLKAFIDALGLQDFILAGHSQGGWPVTRVALDKPGQTRCLINIDTVMVPDDRELMGQALGFLMYQSRMLHPASGPTFYSARRGMRLRYPSGNNITDSKAKRVVEQSQLQKTKDAAAAMRAARMTPLSPAFTGLKQEAMTEIADGGLKARSVVIWGAEDPQVPLALGELFQQQLDDAGVNGGMFVIGGSGHAPFVEFPEKFAEIVVNACSSGNQDN